MLIVNPSYGLQTDMAERSEAQPVNWKSDAIALFSNSKPNAKALLEGIRDQLGDVWRPENVRYVYKDSVSQPAPPELIEQVAREYRAAVLAIAD